MPGNFNPYDHCKDPVCDVSKRSSGAVRRRWRVNYRCPLSGARKRIYRESLNDARYWIEHEFPKLWIEANGSDSTSVHTFRNALDELVSDASAIGVGGRQPIGKSRLKHMERLARLELANWTEIDKVTDQVSAQQCRRFFIGQERKRTRRASEACELIKQACKHALEIGSCTTNPFDGLRVPSKKGVRSLTNDAMPPLHMMKALMRACKAKTLDSNGAPVAKWMNLHLAINIGILAGLRPNEIVALHVEDIDLERNVIHINRAKKVNELRIGKPKSRAGIRSVPFSIELKDLFTDHLDHFRRSNGLVIRNQVGTLVDTNKISAHFRIICREIKLDHFSIQGLRAYYASLMAAQSVPPRILMERMGHTDIQTTMKFYARSLPESARLYTVSFDGE